MSHFPAGTPECANSPWSTDDHFWETLAPFLFPETSFDSAREQADQLLPLVGGRPQQVLDLPCGPGRHAVPLAQHGLAVTGVDCTAHFLQQAQDYANRHHVAIECVQADMRQFVRPAAFDLAVILWSSFGYFQEAHDNLTVLANVHASLKPGGTFVLDLVGKEVLARTFQPVGQREVPGVGLLVERRYIRADWSQLELDWLIIQGEAVRAFRLHFWLYSASELKVLLTQAGFLDVQFYGSLTGKPYGPEAERLIAVAHKR